MKKLVLLIAGFSLSGCVDTLATAAVDVVTLPVKLVSAGVDAVTTSQSERDEKLGREMRKQDEKRSKQWRAAYNRCRKGKPLATDDCSMFEQGRQPYRHS